MWQIDMDKLSELMTYSVSNPLIFSSGLFLFLFAAFSLFYSLTSRTVLLRVVYVTLFSLYFYYKSSGFYFLLLILVATSDFIIGRAIYASADLKRRKMLVGLSVAMDIGMLAYFKYTNMLVDMLNSVFGGHIEMGEIFLPIGISFFTFQSLSYIIDIYRHRLRPLTRWIDYLFYISFFPQLVAGPIVRARDFIPQIYRNPLTVSRSMFGEGVFLVTCGLFKKAVISDFISMNFVDRVFDNPLLYTGLENLFGVYGYALQIYCDFSGYSDMAIGIALLLGFRFNKNFDSPYKSATITEFWRRWHISLSSWLKDYLYISLGGNRRGTLRTYCNLLITMVLGGLWHGASLRFIIWGAIHGVSLAVHKMLMAFSPLFKAQGMDMKSSVWRVLGIVLTFHLVCVGWVFFRAEDMETVKDIFSQIFTSFNLSVLPEFIVGYKGVILLMIVGYTLHFLPDRFETQAKRWATELPMALQALVIALLIWLVMQVKSGDIQPFIYFQF